MVKFVIVFCMCLFITGCDFTMDCTSKPQNEFPCQEKLEPQPRFEPGTIAFEGDSNVHYTNVKAWYGEKAFNTAIAGSRTDHVIIRIPEIKARNPEKVIIQIGGNDLLQLVPFQTITNNFRTIITEYKKFCSKIYIVGIPYVDPSLTIKKAWHIFPLDITYVKIIPFLNLEIAKVCNELGVPYIDIYYGLKENYSDYRKDDVHYNNKGRKVVADLINNVIK